MNLTSALPLCKDKHTVIEDVKLKDSPDLLNFSFYFLLPFLSSFFLNSLKMNLLPCILLESFV